VLGPESDGQYVVNKGLQAGDQIIVEGFQKIRPGAPVQTMPWKGDKSAAAPAPDAAPAQEPAAAAEPNEAKSSE
jgi:membrane fusion protein (multidrug efflux system)